MYKVKYFASCPIEFSILQFILINILSTLFVYMCVWIEYAIHNKSTCWVFFYALSFVYMLFHFFFLLFFNIYTYMIHIHFLFLYILCYFYFYFFFLYIWYKCLKSFTVWNNLSTPTLWWHLLYEKCTLHYTALHTLCFCMHIYIYNYTLYIWQLKLKLYK